MNRLRKVMRSPSVMGLLGGVLVLASSSMAFDWPGEAQSKERTPPAVAVDETPLERGTRMTTSFSPVVKKVAATVVNISSTRTVKQPDVREFFNDPMFRRFFGDQFGGRSGRPRPFKQQSLGSGVIVSKDGYILTNNHVVEDATEIKITLAKSTKEYDAKVVGRDPRTDIAVLKIEAKDLPFAELANSDKVEVGDVVLAIGSPFNLSQTVTMGIVSATKRGGLGIEEYEDFIQTDAAINPGNSGGALVDAEGRLIGINTAILSRTGGSQGVGFAVPINLARDIMERLISTGKVTRGYLGIRFQELTSDLAQEFNVPEGRGGVIVSEVTPDSAAGAAGIKDGDVIIEFNGKPVTDGRQLRLMVAQMDPGKTVNVKALRNNKEQTFRVKLKEFPSEEELAQTGGSTSEPSSEDALDGVTVTDLNAAVRTQMRIPAGIKGAVVTDVDENSVAYESGLRPGDVIQEINRRPINNADDAVQATKNLKGKRILLRVFSQIQGQGGSRYIVVDESKK